MNDKKQPNCQSAIDQLLANLEEDNLGNLPLEKLVQSHPDCANELQQTYDLWQALGTLETPEPSEVMSRRFYQELDAYSTQVAKTVPPSAGFIDQIKQFFFTPSPLRNWGLAFGLFAFGFFSGQFFQQPNQQQHQIDQIAAELKQFKEEMGNQRFEVDLQQSASSRLKDIQFVKNMDSPNQKILMALDKTLRNDPNVNVRLSAIEALVQFSDDPEVMNILIRAIPRQNSPIVLLELAEVMTQLEEKRSASAWKELMEEGELELDVKLQLEESLQTIL
ncbi:MAG: hypothetical protein AAF960_21315 [Bacteroidota bacterium]